MIYGTASLWMTLNDSQGHFQTFGNVISGVHLCIESVASEARLSQVVDNTKRRLRLQHLILDHYCRRLVSK